MYQAWSACKKECDFTASAVMLVLGCRPWLIPLCAACNGCHCCASMVCCGSSHLLTQLYIVSVYIVFVVWYWGPLVLACLIVRPRMMLPAYTLVCPCCDLGISYPSRCVSRVVPCFAVHCTVCSQLAHCACSPKAARLGLGLAALSFMVSESLSPPPPRGARSVLPWRGMIGGVEVPASTGASIVVQT